MRKVTNKGEMHRPTFGSHFYQNSIEVRPQNHQKMISQKHEFKLKGFQNGTKNNANTHQTKSQSCNEKDHGNYQNACFSEW